MPGLVVIKNIPEGHSAGYCVTSNDIYVAPTKPVASVQELRELVEKVRQVIGIPVTCEDRVWGFVSGDLDLPKLYYDETIGKQTITTKVALIAPGAEKMLGVPQTGTYTQEEDISRRTWVRIFPSIRSADEEHKYRISRDELNSLIIPGFALDPLPEEETESAPRRILRGILGRRS